MSESDDLYVAGYAGNDQIDPSESLTGDNTQDPLDAGYSPPDREPHRWVGETEDEVREGESLDDRLAEEQPDVSEADLDAADVGRDGQAASAEEAAVHVIDDDR